MPVISSSKLRLKALTSPCTSGTSWKMARQAPIVILLAVLYRLHLYLIEGAFLESAQGVGSVGNTINGSPQTRGTSFADIFNRHVQAVGLLVLVIGNGECIVLSSLEDEVILPPEDVVFKVTVTCRNKTPVVKLRFCESLFDQFW